MESASGTNRNNLHMVEPDWDEIREQRQARRTRRARRIAVVAGVLAALALVCFLLLIFKTYAEYTVLEEIERSDTSATQYLSFGNGYLQYSNDGASYVTDGDTTIWNQGYEMENPMVAVCDPYVALADRQGETIYVLDTEGLQGEISVTIPITRIDVAAQGTVAVLMSDSGAGYLSVFDKTGGQIAEGAIHVENTGVPMDIALSPDGKNLGVSVVDVSTGTARTTIHFYNFSDAGQKQADNLVAAPTYADTIIPEITYVEDDRLLAFADTGVYLFEGDLQPEESGRVEAADEIQSVFYDDRYFGLVYNDSSKPTGRRIDIYDNKGAFHSSVETEVSFDSVGFLDNHEICLWNTEQCCIYKVSGAQKFDCEFDESIVGVFHGTGYLNYLVLKQNETERIRLVLFADLFRNQKIGGEDNT